MLFKMQHKNAGCVYGQSVYANIWTQHIITAMLQQVIMNLPALKLEQQIQNGPRFVACGSCHVQVEILCTKPPASEALLDAGADVEWPTCNQ